MKKLKMIVVAVVVLAIVGSAFAFKAKVSSFCILTIDDPGSDCTAVVHNLKITSTTPAPGNGITQYKWYRLFDGDPACTNTGNQHCTEIINVKID